MAHVEESYDIVVVGAGHAGCEAALAAARMGFETILFTVSMDSVALMPCNPNIGGSSKGHLVREIDALGGEMGKNIDKTFIQSKMLNVSKGPAVHSLRAQADKVEYTKEMRLTLQEEPRLTLRQQEVSELLVEYVADDNEMVDAFDSDNPVASHSDDNGLDEVTMSQNGVELNNNSARVKKRVAGIVTCSGAVYHAKAVILCTGVYLKARCIYGDTIQETGPNGLMAANHLSDSMRTAGIGIRRFKTGTPPRIDKKSVDFSKMQEQKGDERIVPFSFENCEEDIRREQISCWLTYTNETTHEIIRENIDRSPLYSGVIEGVGPRYCPSIEDKIMKFPDKDRHQLFLEPEGEYTNEMYLDGMPSSMPEDVQYRMVHTVPGLENAKIVRNAYAIEYDCISATCLKPTLEFDDVEYLYSAGQINGSSGYEEAAAQGLMAGINAVRKLQGKPPVVLARSDAYIGVLIDDLVTKETKEPYRMMTSRAEYRLLLRQDNADLRLTDIGHDIGLISDERYAAFEKKRKTINDEIERMRNTFAGANEEVNELLQQYGSTPITSGITFDSLIRRPELSYEILAPIDKERPEGLLNPENSGRTREIIEQINISIKYEGYIKRQKDQVQQFLRMEEKKIPDDIDYSLVKNLRKEARQKLEAVRPASLGQASRISGVSPADVSMLMIYLKK
ncbi:MAG: tRNA uridine-5-carboxymethylaminomethyl(34) synthesis enzyme MnmG [Eubacterium sp.]|nr:tRNA uridine-5-carboxymethylaminomethyl(34) synthesis enzyme MnmG [Eubacterium sp.]